MTRIDGRSSTSLRKIEIIPAIQQAPRGSVMIRWGNTHVVCSVMVEEKIPHWMRESPEHQGAGWITAEYGMLPGCSDKRIQRDKIRQTGRTHEIQRLIGRSIRAALDLKQLGQRTVQIDCDVIQADGGTRVASIVGGYLAFRLALYNLKQEKLLREIPKTDLIGAISVGRVAGEILIDLNYPEDVKAELDANIVMNDRGEFIEIQGTAEKGSFTKKEWDLLLTRSEEGIQQVFEIQKRYLKDWGLV